MMGNKEYSYKRFMKNGFIILFALLIVLALSGLLSYLTTNYENGWFAAAACAISMADTLCLCS